MADAPADYRGFLEIPNLTAITAKIIVTRFSGTEPFLIQAHAAGTRATFSDGGAAFLAMVGRPFNASSDLEFSWDFGDPAGTEDIERFWADNGAGDTKDANTDQTGGHAAYVYRTTGNKTITLDVRGWTGSAYVTASTTTLNTEAFQHVSIRGGPTAGTYTLSFKGQTTAAIARNAYSGDVQSALEILSTIGTNNVEVYGGPQPGGAGPLQVFLTGDLAGAAQPDLTMDVSNLSGAPGPFTAFIRTEDAGATAAQANCTAFAGTSQYFDSNYDGSAGVSDGTISKPFTTYSAIKSWVQGASSASEVPNRRAYLKRGSAWETNTSMSFERGHNGCRIIAYGTGARPRITRTPGGNVFFWSSSYEVTPLSANMDFVFDGIEVVSDSEATVQAVIGTSNSTGLNFYGLGRHFHFLNCFFRGQTAFAMKATDTAWWRCEFDRTPTYIHSIHLSSGTYRWNAFFGCICGECGTRDSVPTRDHHLYLTTWSLLLVRWVKFKQGADKCNYCVNGSVFAQSLGGPKRARGWLIDGNHLFGTQNGLDFSNTLNVADDAFPDRIVVQDNAFAVGQTGVSSHGILAYTPGDITIRDNLFYVNDFPDIQLNGGGRFPVIYRNKSWRTIGTFARMGGGPGGYMAKNQLWNELGGTGMRGLVAAYNTASGLIATTKIDNNEYYSPPGDPILPFYDATASVGLAKAAWQAQGFDLGTTFRTQNFGWADPAAGDFSVVTGAATSFAVTGPTTCTVGQASEPFEASPMNGSDPGLYTGTVTITDSPDPDGAATPSELTWSGTAEPKLTTYTATATGVKTITFTPSGGLTPVVKTVTASAPVIEGSVISIDGPHTVEVEAVSANFIVSLDAPRNVVVSLASTGATLTPSTLTFTVAGGVLTQNFTGQWGTTGAKSIVVTNDAGMTNPAPWTISVTSGGETTSPRVLIRWFP